MGNADNIRWAYIDIEIETDGDIVFNKVPMKTNSRTLYVPCSKDIYLSEYKQEDLVEFLKEEKDYCDANSSVLKHQSVPWFIEDEDTLAINYISLYSAGVSCLSSDLLINYSNQADTPLDQVYINYNAKQHVTTGDKHCSSFFLMLTTKGKILDNSVAFGLPANDGTPIYFKIKPLMKDYEREFNGSDAELMNGNVVQSYYFDAPIITTLTKDAGNIFSISDRADLTTDGTNYLIRVKSVGSSTLKECPYMLYNKSQDGSGSIVACMDCISVSAMPLREYSFPNMYSVVGDDSSGNRTTLEIEMKNQPLLVGAAPKKENYVSALKFYAPSAIHRAQIIAPLPSSPVPIKKHVVYSNTPRGVLDIINLGSSSTYSTYPFGYFLTATESFAGNLFTFKDFFQVSTIKTSVINPNAQDVFKIIIALIYNTSFAPNPFVNAVFIYNEKRGISSLSIDIENERYANSGFIEYSYSRNVESKSGSEPAITNKFYYNDIVLSSLPTNPLGVPQNESVEVVLFRKNLHGTKLYKIGGLPNEYIIMAKSGSSFYGYTNPNQISFESGDLFEIRDEQFDEYICTLGPKNQSNECTASIIPNYRHRYIVGSPIYLSDSAVYSLDPADVIVLDNYQMNGYEGVFLNSISGRNEQSSRFVYESNKCLIKLIDIESIRNIGYNTLQQYKIILDEKRYAFVQNDGIYVAASKTHCSNGVRPAPMTFPESMNILSLNKDVTTAPIASGTVTVEDGFITGISNGPGGFNQVSNIYVTPIPTP